MNGLYAIVDTTLLASRKTDPVRYAAALLEARPAALQLRAKDICPREILALLRVLGPMCRAARVPLVANDRADLASLAGCEAVHIGQEDMPFELVQRIAPQLSIGVSTHDEAQLERALARRPRYVGYGPVFATTTKRDAGPTLGVKGLAHGAQMARAAGVPLVAIGGITLERVPELARHVAACAIISDLYLPGFSMRDVTERAFAVQAAFASAAPGFEAHP